MPANVERCPLDQLPQRLGLREPLMLAAESRGKALTQWQMETDDGPILSYLYRQLRPRRHLEFGTWQGAGTLRCLQACDATVWTVNLLEGETAAPGQWSYYSDFAPEAVPVHWTNPRTTRSGRVVCQTDALGFIGREYLSRGLGHRVCQIYCDSQAWDTSNYPADFFDTALIDGGHTPDVVVADTRKALSVLRPGGVMLWHDFCLDTAVLDACESVRGVAEAIDLMRPHLAVELQDLFWIDPSWILVGVKSAQAGQEQQV